MNNSPEYTTTRNDIFQKKKLTKNACQKWFDKWAK